MEMGTLTLYAYYNMHFDFDCSYDDLVVGAPIYAEPNRPDIGRIFIFYNNKVNFHALIVHTMLLMLLYYRAKD